MSKYGRIENAKPKITSIIIPARENAFEKKATIALIVLIFSANLMKRIHYCNIGREKTDFLTNNGEVWLNFGRKRGVCTHRCNLMANGCFVSLFS